MLTAAIAIMDIEQFADWLWDHYFCNALLDTVFCFDLYEI